MIFDTCLFSGHLYCFSVGKMFKKENRLCFRENLPAKCEKAFCGCFAIMMMTHFGIEEVFAFALFFNFTEHKIDVESLADTLFRHFCLLRASMSENLFHSIITKQ